MSDKSRWCGKWGLTLHYIWSLFSGPRVEFQRLLTPKPHTSQPRKVGQISVILFKLFWKNFRSPDAVGFLVE